MRGVELRERAADLGSEDPLEGLGQRVDDDNLAPALPGARGDLRAGPAGADHGDPAARLHRLPQRQRVVETPEVQHSRQVGAGDGQSAHLRAGGQHQPVESEPTAPGERDCPGCEIDTRRRGAEQHVDLVGRVEAVGVDPGRRRLVAPGEHALGERRPLVRQVPFGADEPDGPVPSLRPGALRGLGAGQARSDDDQPVRQRSPPGRAEPGFFQRNAATASLSSSGSVWRSDARGIPIRRPSFVLVTAVVPRAEHRRAEPGDARLWCVLHVEADGERSHPPLASHRSELCSNRRQRQGCMQDRTIDHLRVDVGSFETSRRRTRRHDYVPSPPSVGSSSRRSMTTTGNWRSVLA